MVIKRPTPDRVLQLLSYDPDSGSFKWLVSKARLAKAGQKAGSPTKGGRIQISIDGRYQYAHRLAFVFMLGRFPVNQVDHIDGDPLNNRWANLRECTQAQNMQNKPIYKRNRSGFIGVSRITRGRRWRATIKVNSKCFHLGSFDTPEEAHRRYLEAKAVMHPFNPVSRSARV